MTIFSQGAALFFTRKELEAAHLNPETLTEQEALPLIFHTLRQAGHPIPPRLEIRCFSEPHGVLFFLRSQMEDIPSDCSFSVTFS